MCSQLCFHYDVPLVAHSPTVHSILTMNGCHGNLDVNIKSPVHFFTLLGVRSLANASRARQFNPLNPPRVGWVNFIFFKVRVSITCVQNLGAVRRERFLTIDNPLNPPAMGWVKFFF